MCSWCGFVQLGGDSASLATANASLRPRYGFSHPYKEHMTDTYIIKSKLFLTFRPYMFGMFDLS